MKIVALLCGASFLVVGTLVGIRMLLLARRTRSLPELLLGGGLCSLTFVTLPSMALSHVPGLMPTGAQQVLYVLGLLPLVGFAMCLLGFTGHVFRRSRPWVRAAVIAAGVLVAIGIAGTATVRITTWGDLGPVSPAWTGLLITPFMTGMAWTGFESLHYYLKLRRRVPLGLADPVVCNRFLLWSAGNLGAVFFTAIIVASPALGWAIIQHPVPIFSIGAAGLVLSTSWFLAFLPPEAYLRRVSAPAR